MSVDCIYVAASRHDARFTRTCIASIRYFYPDIPVKLLVGGQLEKRLVSELAEYPNLTFADLPRRNYGWGFVKLEPLFGPPGERFLMLDSDTVLTGPVLRVADENEHDFIVDREDEEESRAKEIYFDWTKFPADRARPFFFFNTGQWFGRSGVLRRDDFAELIEWTSPPRLLEPSTFKNGEQGVLNFVVNTQFASGHISVLRVPLMCWPGRDTSAVNSEKVAAGSAPARIVHWAGFKGSFHGSLPRGDLLMFYENIYYRGLRNPLIQRAQGICRHIAYRVGQRAKGRVGSVLRRLITAP